MCRRQPFFQKRLEFPNFSQLHEQHCLTEPNVISSVSKIKQVLHQGFHHWEQMKQTSTCIISWCRGPRWSTKTKVLACLLKKKVPIREHWIEMSKVCFLNKKLDSQYCQAAVAIVYYIICVPEHKIYKNSPNLSFCSFVVLLSLGLLLLQQVLEEKQLVSICTL